MKREMKIMLLQEQGVKKKANHSIAFGDCFAAILAMNMDYHLLTEDEEFKNLMDKVKIELICSDQINLSPLFCPD